MFDFEIARIFYFLCGDVPFSPFYGVYIPQLDNVPCVSDFNKRNNFLTDTIPKQCFRYAQLQKKPANF